jgi:Response regulator containing a CheY-like receiver domain and an HTH DNA-binding domain
VGSTFSSEGSSRLCFPAHHFTTTDGVEPPDLVICDIARIDPDDVADNFPDVPILGYANHTDTSGLRRAHAAGFDQVVAKSALFERTSELIDPLLASVE